MGRVTFRHSFLVWKLPTSADGILGLNFLTPRRARVDLGKFSLEVALNPNSDLVAPPLHESRWEECKRREGRDPITHVSISQNLSRAGTAVLEGEKFASRTKLESSGEETPHLPEETNSIHQELARQDSGAWTVINRETVVLQPRAKHTVLGKVQGRSSKSPSCLLCVEPAHVPIEGICVARVLT
jgi:hypothetical protein